MRQVEKNVTPSAIVGIDNVNIDSYLKSLCDPQYCTIASTCDSASDPLFQTTNPVTLPEYIPGQACCGGGNIGSTCSSLGHVLPTCDLAGVCQVSLNVSDNNSYCGPVNKRATQWIGVVITLIGAAFLNVGLNLQKLALRKRHEKTQAKKLQKRMVERLSAIRLGAIRFPSFSSQMGNLKKRTSSATSSVAMSERRPRGPSEIALGSGDTFIEDDSQTLPDLYKTSREREPNSTNGGLYGAGEPSNHISRNHLDLAIDHPRAPALRITARSPLSATVTREDGTTEDIPLPSSPEDKPEFQKNLNFSNLAKNPIWVLGMVIFVFSNFLNFIALQFAPQSLVAPLGSISLVVNVILAPIINGEKFTWKDIVGVVLIVAGSSMTVAFAGVSGKGI
jgi:multidrug transporter EmrE-like cation transporter